MKKYQRKNISYTKLRARNKKVWGLILKGEYSPQEIAKKTGCNVQSVYDLRYKMKKAGVEFTSVRSSRRKLVTKKPVQEKAPLTFWQRLKSLFRK